MTDESLDQQALLELLGFVQLPSVPEPTLAQMDAHEQFARGKQAAERGWKPAARKTLESVQDLLMGALGFPQNDSRSSLAGEMLSAAVPVVGGLKAIRIKNPIKAWHGSPHDFQKFDISKAGSTTDEGLLGRAMYFTTSEDAAKLMGRHRYEVELDIKNPLRIQQTDWDWRTKGPITRKALGLSDDASAEAVRDAAVSQGFDGVELDTSPLGFNHKEYAVFDDNLIKIVQKLGIVGAVGAGLITQAQAEQFRAQGYR